MDVRHVSPETLMSSSARVLAGLIRSGAVRAREVCEAHLSRIHEVNPAINAVVAERAEEALQEADAADAQVRQRSPSELPPLHGVPCTIKEAFAFAGMPNTSGLVARRGLQVTEDAPTVARLRAAGAIPLGVTNTSELCLWMESANRVYGRSNNPYDVRCTVGGSSGGEGAIIGAGGSPFGVGSDLGGSIRIPAFFNGIFGHKPSPGLVSNDGQHPMPAKEMPMLATGPMARRAEDLDLLLSIMSGTKVADPSKVEPASLRVLVVTGDGRSAVEPALLEAQQAAADALAERGCRVAHVELEDLRHGFEVWTARLYEASKHSFNELLGEGRPLNPLLELLRFTTGRSPFTFPAVAMLSIELAAGAMKGGRAKALVAGERLDRTMAALLGNDGVLLYPPYPALAPRHGAPMLRPLRMAYTGLFNALGLPVTQVPLGLHSSGLPLGVQVVALPGRDVHTLAVARWLEQDFGGWVRPRA